MKIAVATQDYRTITTHGGRARLFLVFEAEPGAEPVEAGRLELAPDMVLHHHGDGGPHPIDGVQVLIVGSSGQGFVNHMRRRGIVPAVTSMTDPVEAVKAWLAGALPAAEAPHHPHEHHEGDHHHHGHDHHHHHHDHG